MLHLPRVATVQPRTNLNEHVYETLRQRILARVPGAGAKLSLHELATELGVSRSPVHHALTRLVSEGLLTVKSRRGYYVTPVTARGLHEGYEVRLGLELHAASRSVGQVEGHALLRFRELLDATTEALSHEEWDAANAAFHEYQVDLAGNAALSSVYRALPVNLMMQVIRGGRLEGSSELSTQHTAIVEAFEAGDVEAARAAITRHVETGEHIALDAIERAGGAL
jgi:DNA-binding GntR family transcriptional regulator